MQDEPTKSKLSRNDIARRITEMRQIQTYLNTCPIDTDTTSQEGELRRLFDECNLPPSDKERAENLLKAIRFTLHGPYKYADALDWLQSWHDASYEAMLELMLWVDPLA